jgi:hypothetical protein
VKVKQPGVSVTARHGYLALSAPAVAAAGSPATRSVSSLAADELARLSRLRIDSPMFSYAAVRDTALDLVVELSGGTFGAGWANGAEVQASLTRGGGEAIVATGRIEPAARGTIVRLPLAGGEAGPWRVSVRVSGAAGVLTDQIEVVSPRETSSLGPPVVFRATASSRIPARPVADFQFRRNERIRVQWPVRAPLEERTARLLDRRGDPLALPVALTEADGVLTADLNLAPLSEGDYVIELSAAQRKEVVAFRVVR